MGELSSREFFQTRQYTCTSLKLFTLYTAMNVCEAWLRQRVGYFPGTALVVNDELSLS